MRAAAGESARAHRAPHPSPRDAAAGAHASHTPVRGVDASRHAAARTHGLRSTHACADSNPSTHVNTDSNCNFLAHADRVVCCGLSGVAEDVCGAYATTGSAGGIRW